MARWLIGLYVSYGLIGLEVILNTLDNMFTSPSLDTSKLDTAQTAPLPTDIFIRRVLIPEVAIRLIAEDLNLSPKDPKVHSTLEDSRAYGVARFSGGDVNTVALKVEKQSSLPCLQRIRSPAEKRFLTQVPDGMVPYLGLNHNPPANGHCGYQVIAAATGIKGTGSYLAV